MRSKLFVPASRPELFGKALASAADALSFDLEDAVAPAARPQARLHLQDLLRGLGGACTKTLIARVNACGSPDFTEDLGAIVWPALHVLNLPKVEDALAVRTAAAVLERLEHQRGVTRPIRLLATIETPRGLRDAAAIARAHPRLMGLQIGYGDLFAPLGISRAHTTACDAVRIAVRLAAAEGALEAFDGAFPDIGNAAGFRRDAQQARDLGLAGKSCIHPSQIAAANEVFMPTSAEIEQSVTLVTAARRALARGTGAITVDGKLIDAPYLRQAEQLVERARSLGLCKHAPSEDTHE